MAVTGDEHHNASPSSRWVSMKHAFTSWHAFHDSMRLQSASSMLANEDLLPSPPERQTWTVWNFFAYWWSESWAVSTWSLGSSLIALGATVRDALLVVLFANILSAVVIVLNGRAASRYHIGYPVLARVTFGIYGSYFFVVLRAILGVIWASQQITTQGMIGFFLAFVFTLPLMLIHTSKIRHLFSFKSVVFPLAALGVVCWATTANGGRVSANKLEDTSLQSSSTAVFAWGIIGQFNAVMGANSALLVTVPDLARYSKTKNAQLWGQLLGLPIAQLICAAIGIITTSAVHNMWGELFWNPYDLLDAILDHSYTSKARAGVFFASASFAFATMGTSIACNIVPFAADVTCLAPKYVNIIRGQFICLILAFAIVPWRIVSSANGFLSFLSGYSIFQGSVVSIMTVDYFLLRRGNLHISAMFTTSRLGEYYYNFGVNWTGIAAFIAGFLLPLPGFISSFGTVSFSSTAATDIFVTARKTVRSCSEVAFEANVPKSIGMGVQSDTLVVDGIEIVVGMSTHEQDDMASSPFSVAAGPAKGDLV
ncbi:hypothetical protein UA08_02038 [Talaromyces atroroseus]|uniref:Allantoin permease n=1 Tax=Talaromyces atroroseus TaxID=1441469 RepID=A0A1Q5QCD6_TALAT|nr:hypothetical protein UA08_02038 [Talaromyces atroroseus]OKL63541.1 hypothetical protein UA08_02038 [Talaromyces atroroseus]